MLGIVHSRRYTNVLSWESVGCKSYAGGNRRESILLAVRPSQWRIQELGGGGGGGTGEGVARGGAK